jgi:hypothetical protein
MRSWSPLVHGLDNFQDGLLNHRIRVADRATADADQLGELIAGLGWRTLWHRYHLVRFAAPGSSGCLASSGGSLLLSGCRFPREFLLQRLRPSRDHRSLPFAEVLPMQVE